MLNLLKMLNKTHLEHTVIAACLQFVLTLLLCLFAGGLSFAVILAGALPGCFLFFGREHAQRERLLKTTLGLADAQAVVAAINLMAWDADSKLDFWCPVAGAVAQSALWLIVMFL